MTSGSTLRLRRTESSIEIELDDRGRTLRAGTEFVSPTQERDGSDTRWLVEDHPRLYGQASDDVAARVVARLDALGTALGAKIFESPETGSVADALRDPDLIARLQVQVIEAPGAPWLPWELTALPGAERPLALEAASFARVAHEAPDRDAARADDEVLRVLLVTCRPHGADDVPFRSVASRVVHAVAMSDANVHLDVLRPATFAALRKKLRLAHRKGRPYDMVHFDGHGLTRPSMFDESVPRGFLLFEDEADGTEEVAGSVLGQDLAEHGVRLLLLNACRSARRPGAYELSGPSKLDRAFGSLADEVIAAGGVEGVLAMGYNVYVATAAQVIADTYAALVSGHRLGEAVAHARRRMYARGGSPFDWLVPIVFESARGESAATPSDIVEVPIEIGAATPGSDRVIDPGANAGARSSSRPYFGYDDELLMIDRAATRGQAIELIGVAGSGKSAVAGEFARWWATTSGQTVVVVDMAPDGSEQRPLELLEKHPDALPVLEDAVNALRWRPATEATAALRTWVEERVSASRPLLMTGRDACGIAGVKTVALTGLDTEARVELASDVDADVLQHRLSAAFLSWTQGVPDALRLWPVFEQRARQVDGGTGVLAAMRSGLVDPIEFGLALIDASAIDFFIPPEFVFVVPAIAHSFQGWIDNDTAKSYAQDVERSGIKLSPDGEHVAKLHEELDHLARSGLACRIEEGVLLHPLTPIATKDLFGHYVRQISGNDDEKVAEIFFRFDRSFITVILAWTALVALPGVKLRAPASRGHQNALRALALALRYQAWPHVRPLLKNVLTALTNESRFAERRDLVGEVTAAWLDSTNQSPDDGILPILADELERDGDTESARALRELELRNARQDDRVLVAEEGGVELDVGRNRQVNALLQAGEAELAEGAASGLDHLLEALRIAMAGDDKLRAGRALVHLARAHNRLPAFRDLSKSEAYARQAVETGLAMMPLGERLVIDGGVSLANAILDQEQGRRQPDKERLDEAAAALLPAVNKGDKRDRAAARNSLGMLESLRGDFDAAADHFMEAHSLFVEIGGSARALVAQGNLARSLALAGRYEDASSVAKQGLEALGESSSSAALADLFAAVLAEARKHRPEGG